jgi:hypothetical protein
VRFGLEAQPLHAALKKRFKFRRLPVVLLSEQLFENAHVRVRC